MADEIKVLSAIRIPRWYETPGKTPVSYQLHVFGDASEKAYAAAAYVQSICDDGSSSSSALLVPKSKITPREKISLPCLELMAALSAARLRAFVVQNLRVRFNRVVHYTDSAVSYYWCTAEEPSRWKMFVRNRAKEIQQLTSRDEWVHVTGASNTADITTRGISAEDLVKNQQWWFGPAWLAAPEEKRLDSRLRCGGNKTEPLVNELRVVVAPTVIPALLVNLNRFGSWEKAVRVVASVLWYVWRCHRQPPLTDVALRTAAELYIIKVAQRSHFAAEIAAVQTEERPRRKRENR